MVGFGNAEAAENAVDMVGVSGDSCGSLVRRITCFGQAIGERIKRWFFMARQGWQSSYVTKRQWRMLPLVRFESNKRHNSDAVKLGVNGKDINGKTRNRHRRLRGVAVEADADRPKPHSNMSKVGNPERVKEQSGVICQEVVASCRAKTGTKGERRKAG